MLKSALRQKCSDTDVTGRFRTPYGKYRMLCQCLSVLLKAAQVAPIREMCVPGAWYVALMTPAEGPSKKTGWLKSKLVPTGLKLFTVTPPPKSTIL